jgi:undecaprenyl-diphosphatase
MESFIQAALLGLLEGATEFIPVSSTGHLILGGHFLGFNSPGKTFEVLIQLGAILAITLIYFGKLWPIVKALPHDKSAQQFALGVFVAFLPAALIGAVLHSFIKEVLFNPWVVCVSLITGGFILMMVDQMRFHTRHEDATQFPLRTCVLIGMCQCVAMIPGVSRSGATIVGGLFLGASKRAATEFSFFLAMPTMAGAFTYDLLKNYKNLSFEDGKLITIGFVFAFCAGLFVVKKLLDYVSRYGFGLFAWWRILVGSAGLAGLLVFG